MVSPGEAGQGNDGALFTLKREMERTPGLKVTIPYLADDNLIDEALSL